MGETFYYTARVTELLLIVAGLALLVVGGEFMVKGAVALARRLRISTWIIGATVVAIATSMPELAVTFDAFASGAPELAVGNVVGTNIVNVLFIIGCGALIAPLVIQPQLLRFDIPIMVGITILMLVLSLDGSLGLFDGAVLLVAFVGVMLATVLNGRRSAGGQTARGQTADGIPDRERPVWRALISVAFGVLALILGAQFLVEGAVAVATTLGVSDLIIGLTVVAVGTSLPELASMISAVRAGESDVALGNVVGTNMVNIGLVLGLPTILSSGVPVPASALALDIPLMIAAAAAFAVVAYTGHRVVRLEGAVFLALYLIYLVYIGLASAHHDALEGFTWVMLWFVFPLVLLAALISVIGEMKARRSEG